MKMKNDPSPKEDEDGCWYIPMPTTEDCDEISKVLREKVSKASRRLTDNHQTDKRRLATMLQKSIDDTSWRDVLAGMFTDRRFRQFKKFRYYGEIDSMRIGVVVASKGASYNNYALNKLDVENLIAAKRSGKVDHAFVVAAVLNVYVGHHDVEELHASLLQNLPCRSGQFGEFWTLTEYEITGVEEPF
jgi:hypothetical protein